MVVTGIMSTNSGWMILLFNLKVVAHLRPVHVVFYYSRFWLERTSLEDSLKINISAQNIVGEMLKLKSN